jgi:AraC-like DNA-binding protein
VREINSFIEVNFHKGIGIQDISAHMNLNRNHLSKMFKSVTGLSLRDFILYFRISKACELMQNTHYTINEISSMVGYTNSFNFSRAFKAVKGESPRGWREKNKLR